MSIIFGIAETCEIGLFVWRKSVDDISKFILGNVEVDDAFRLGQFKYDKIQPVFLKLRSASDQAAGFKNHLETVFLF
jgi:hypothetical protein